MTRVIDASTNLAPFAETLAKSGVQCAIRYYNHTNGGSLPEKRIEPNEAETLAEAGIQIATVFQQSGGRNKDVSDFSEKQARRDAKRALELAKRLPQPKGSAIYFAVDDDFVFQRDLKVINRYFEIVKEKLNGQYRVGAYGSGRVLRMLLDAENVDLCWLSQSHGWSGYIDFVKSLDWALMQGTEGVWPKAGFRFDSNKINPAIADFGQFTPDNAAPPQHYVADFDALYQVIARNGLNLRRGPDTKYDVIRTLSKGTVVAGLEQAGQWIKIDDEGDGFADGYVHKGYLKLVIGDLDDSVTDDQSFSPFLNARRELLKDIKEYRDDADNPRIVLYHKSTNKGEPDATPWCSSFVNWCVKKSGLSGTDSKWAMTWHDEDWGDNVTPDPQIGDIVVYKRKWKRKDGTEGVGGHVGFFVEYDTKGHIQLLGGNQSNRVSVDWYPAKSGLKGTQTYELLSIRRPPLSLKSGW